MIDFDKLERRLLAKGYRAETAAAKIAHDVVLKAIKAAGFHDNVTIKGGVAMSGITNVARRATMDMDFDMLRYSISETALRRFVSRLNKSSECSISIDGTIRELLQQEYRGKRLNLKITDGKGRSVWTKIDVGVHTNKRVKQADFNFRVVTDRTGVKLLANPREQIFVEKLKSLLRIGFVSTRIKDVYDMCFLARGLRKSLVKTYLEIFVYGDPRMRERNVGDIVQRLERVFSNRTFVRRLANPAFAWLDISGEDAARTIVEFVKSL